MSHTKLMLNIRKSNYEWQPSGKALNAEVMVQHNIALLTVDHLTLLFKESFSDCKIAKKYASHRTKTTANIKSRYLARMKFPEKTV